MNLTFSAEAEDEVRSLGYCVQVPFPNRPYVAEITCRVVSDSGKRNHRRCQVGTKKVDASESLMRSGKNKRMSKTMSGIVMNKGGTYLLPMRHELGGGFCSEQENLLLRCEGKYQTVYIVREKVPMCIRGEYLLITGEVPVKSMERREVLSSL